LTFDYQTLMVVEKKAKGDIETLKILGVSFVPLTGEHHSQPSSWLPT
jgi:hypothetical protein